jgi:hypothetical protein
LPLKLKAQSLKLKAGFFSSLRGYFVPHRNGGKKGQRHTRRNDEAIPFYGTMQPCILRLTKQPKIIFRQLVMAGKKDNVIRGCAASGAIAHVGKTHLIENFDKPCLSNTGKQKGNFFLHCRTCYGSLPPLAREACCVSLRAGPPDL